VERRARRRDGCGGWPYERWRGREQRAHTPPRCPDPPPASLGPLEPAKRATVTTATCQRAGTQTAAGRRSRGGTHQLLGMHDLVDGRAVCEGRRARLYLHETHAEAVDVGAGGQANALRGAVPRCTPRRRYHNRSTDSMDCDVSRTMGWRHGGTEGGTEGGSGLMSGWVSEGGRRVVGKGERSRQQRTNSNQHCTPNRRGQVCANDCSGGAAATRATHRVSVESGPLPTDAAARSYRA
jgi:hypothetical protein